MEAGLEHLARGTTSGMDAFVVVIEPGARSVQTYMNVKRLAADLGVKQVKVVANKVRSENPRYLQRICLVLSITIPKSLMQTVRDSLLMISVRS